MMRILSVTAGWCSMADVKDVKSRSYNMSQIRNKDTSPERIVRNLLASTPHIYKCNACELFGTPDIVFPEMKAVIFVNGCYWHGHDCHLFRLPKSNSKFWKDKIRSNILRDIAVRNYYVKSDWRQLVIWECAIKGKDRYTSDALLRLLEDWLYTRCGYNEIRGIQCNS